MIVTYESAQSSWPSLPDEPRSSSCTDRPLPPARIVLVPFSLDEVEPQPEDGSDLLARLTHAAPCS